MIPERDKTAMTGEQIEEALNSSMEYLTEDDKLMKDIEDGTIEVPAYDSVITEEVRVVTKGNGSKAILNERLEDNNVDIMKDIEVGGTDNLNEIIPNDDSMKEILGELMDDVSESDYTQFMAVAKRYRLGEKFSVYNSLPLVFQNLIKASLSGMPIPAGQTPNSVRNSYAKMFIDNMINDAVINQEVIEYEEEMRKALSDTPDAVKNFISDQRLNFEVALLKNADKYDEEAKTFAEEGNIEEADTKSALAATLREMSKSYIQSYTYENMVEDFKTHPGKYRLKAIDVEKFRNRVCEPFMIKYEHSKYVIKHIDTTIPVLLRLNSQITEMDVARFINLFVKYAQNMRPDNHPEHVFMLYFIVNILQTEFPIPEDDKDSLKFIESTRHNIISTINVLREFNNEPLIIIEEGIEEDGN